MAENTRLDRVSGRASRTIAHQGGHQRHRRVARAPRLPGPSPPTATRRAPRQNFGGDGAAYALLKRQRDRTSADLIDRVVRGPGDAPRSRTPPTKIVHGVEAEVDGQALKVRAKNGVVLACGGFENNARSAAGLLRQHVLAVARPRPAATKATASAWPRAWAPHLWHMNNFAPPPTASSTTPTTQTPTLVFMKFAASCGIVVGDDGTRIDESHVLFPMGNPATGPRQGVRTTACSPAPCCPTTCGTSTTRPSSTKARSTPSWSPDGSDEMEKGWIQKADTLEELRPAHRPRRGGDRAALSKTRRATTTASAPQGDD